jgi:clan AA aspartic protease
MSGIVNASGEAILSLEIRGLDGSSTIVNTVIDTGFTGYLTLPQAIVDSLSLPLLSATPVTLADGSTTILGVYEATVVWHDHTRDIECLATEGGSLFGMALLHGSKMEMEITGGGVVEIHPLS